MQPIEKIDWEILNATADDWENLEQIYGMICFKVLHDDKEESNGENVLLRPVHGAPALAELADRIRKLVEIGLLSARLPNSDTPVLDLTDLTYVWRAWFAMTTQGRNAWASSEHAAAVVTKGRIA